jgi:glycosyltransferase involved in cell wall biosynthesis
VSRRGRRVTAPDVAVVVATKNRERLLVERSLLSVSAQTRAPGRVIVVTDGGPLSAGCLRRIGAVLGSIPWSVLENTRTSGVAGAWNTALEFLSKVGHRGFVALLDDDDAWDREHIEANYAAAISSAANIAVSGLRLSIRGELQARPLIERLEPRAFLVGNPGWQGSNTFVDLALFMEAGAFDETLVSLHDRDLALRLLRCPAARPVLVREWTSTWHFGTPGSLSLPGTPGKLQGLRRFWQIYGHMMSADEESAFFGRAERLFGFRKSAICATTVVNTGAGD